MPNLNVAKLAGDGARWRGTVGAAAFERLGEVLFGQTGGSEAELPAVDISLEFARDGEGRPRVMGSCRVAAAICCSGCAETVEVDVASRLDFVVVASEAEAERLMPEVDVVVSEEAALPVTTLVEDDILLSIPETACGQASTCPHALSTWADEEVSSPTGRKPFEALQELLPGPAPV